jgi:hypothetical protein
MVVVDLSHLTLTAKAQFWRAEEMSCPPIYLAEADRVHDSLELPIVVVYNGHNHYVPTTMVPDSSLNQMQKDQLLEHIFQAMELFPKIQWQPHEKKLRMQ